MKSNLVAKLIMLLSVLGAAASTALPLMGVSAPVTSAVITLLAAAAAALGGVLHTKPADPPAAKVTPDAGR